MWKIYILFSKKTEHTYVGCSEDINKRLKQHNSGQVKSTHNGCPWGIIYQEDVGTYLEARHREKYYKSGAGRKKIAEIIEKRGEVA